MKLLIIIFSLLISNACNSADASETLNISCYDYSWSSVEALVHPYIDEVIYTSLVMQGISSNYKTSEAAKQVIGEKLPSNVTRILKELIKEDC